MTTLTVKQKNVFSIGWFAQQVLQYPVLTLQMILASVMIQLFAMGMPLFYMVIFDRVFGRHNLATLDVMAVGMILVLLFNLLLQRVRSYVLSQLVLSIDQISFETFLTEVFQLSLAKATREQMRSLSQRFGDLVKTTQVVAMTLLVTSMDVVFSSAMVALMMLMHFQLAVVSLVPITLMALLTFLVIPAIKNRARQFEQEQRRFQQRLGEVLDSSETLHSINALQAMQNRLKQAMSQSVLKTSPFRFDRMTISSIQTFISGLGVLLLLYFGAHEVLQGEISFGVYIAISMLGRQVTQNAQRLFDSLLQFQESLSTIEQLKGLDKDFLESQLKPDGIVLDTVKGHIELVNVRFKYTPNAPWVLNNLNLDIQPGQKVILAGQSGVGKTTLIRLLQRLYAPHSGYIRLDGYNLADMDEFNLRQHIGVALQKPSILAGTVRDNIAIGKPEASLKDITEAAAFAQLDSYLLNCPDGFETQIGVMGSNLSGGQAARVAFARTILNQPSILILDEALSPLEPAMQAAIYQSIWQKYAHATCIFVTDFLSAHQQADRIVVLQDGHVVEDGCYDDLIKQKGYYYHLHKTGL